MPSPILFLQLVVRFNCCADLTFALPRAENRVTDALATEALAAVPAKLQNLFCVPDAWLQQISDVKLRIVALAYFKVTKKIDWLASAQSRDALAVEAQKLVPVLVAAIKVWLQRIG